ncbi:MAG: universal stress protein [Mucilaginibacter sp.]|uniref:universal stress protein n=1 Tax=Mucilaginibacter sp. TaxID=1882438 RepID=UPI0031B29EA5
MKTILMLTDFSENATHALKSASLLVEKMQAGVLLFNSYYDHPIFPVYGGGAPVIEQLLLRKEESTVKLIKLTNQLKHMFARQSKNIFKPVIEYMVRKGSVYSNVQLLLKEKDVVMIVMGGSSNSSLEHLFFGCDTMEVISNSTCPVMVIPGKSAFNKLNKLTLATAFELSDINAITYLADLGKSIGFEIDVVHVSTSAEKDLLVQERAFLNHINALKDVRITYHRLQGKDVIKRLNRYCKENGSDILALVHYKQGFLSTLFKQSTTKKTLSGRHIPLMIIPFNNNLQQTSFELHEPVKQL